MTKPKKKGDGLSIDAKSGDDTTSSGQEFCRICSAPRINEAGKVKSFINHHLSYSPSHTIRICRGCHQIIHAEGRVNNHPYKKLFGREWFIPYAIRCLVVAEEELGIGYIKNISMEGEK